MEERDHIKTKLKIPRVVFLDRCRVSISEMALGIACSGAVDFTVGFSGFF